ncbi:MAG: AarF/UbiB family protein, partial [Pseudomonadota bacterium]|nr:AarF/UbiB family protein [Pseudomonadota bacterium]
MSYPLIKLYRLFRIIIVYRVDQLILPKNRCISPWLFWLYPFQTYKIKKLTPQDRMVEAIVAMGPIFVKFAQILSSRFDMLPDDIAQSLAQLQDKVPPFPFDEAKSILESHYKKPLSSIFSSFEKIPLGSASLAQVYGACLLDGSEVAIKILRPDIIQHVNKDLSLLRYIAERIDRYHPNRHLIRVMDVIESFEKSCHTECDLRNEAGNYSYMRTLFEGSNDLYIPKVYWQYSTANILIVERIYGIPVADQAQLLDTNIHVTKLARKNIEIFFKQVFEHNFFHGDLHPGNLFVDYSKTHDPMFIAVDFGIVGCLSKQDQYYLAENIISFLNRDYARVVDL